MNKILAILASIGTTLAAVFAALMYREKAQSAIKDAKASEDSRKAQDKATEAMVKGMERGEKDVEDFIKKRKIRRVRAGANPPK